MNDFTGVVSESERETIEKLGALKRQSGSHAASISVLRERIPELDIKIDACFLSNPYATDLFMNRLTADLLDTGQLRDVLESYPAANLQIAELLEPAVDVGAENIFVCNGAVEAIQAAMHRFAGVRVGVILPTFSPYYEYLRPDQEVVFHHLRREDDFELDTEEFAAFVRTNNLDTVALINPNNPNGGYVSSEAMRGLLDEFSDLELVILDESFVEFAYEDDQLNRRSLATEVADRPNVILVKSMSKDFGVAGLRAAYAIMSGDRVRTLTANGYLWNVSGLTEFFFRIFGEDAFQDQYIEARLRYLEEAMQFFEDLKGIDHLYAYPTKANFCLVELDDSIPIELLAPLMLIRHGIYVRDCRDKRGLEGQYLRVAGRKAQENRAIIEGLSELVPECRELT